MNLEIGNKVRVLGKGNFIWELVAKTSPIRESDWLVRNSKGSMLSVKPENLKPAK
jgi:hypothetical protein